MNIFQLIPNLRQNYSHKFKSAIFLYLTQVKTYMKTAASSGIETTELRYQKALKQINKLITVNNQLQQTSNKHLYTIHELNNKLEMQQEIYKNLVEERNQLWEKVSKFQAEKMHILKQHQQITRQLGKNKTYNFPGADSDADAKNKRKQIQANFTNSLNSQEMIKNINSEKGRELRDQPYADVEGKNKKNQDFNSSTNGYSHANGFKNNNLQTLGRTDSSSRQLVKKLSIANQFISKVNAQSVQLKSRLVRIQSSNKLLSARSLEALPKYSPQITPRINDLKQLYKGQTRNSAQVLKKLHKLEEQNKKLTKKYENSRAQFQKTQEQNKKLKKQHNKTTFQISKYEALVTKQQDFINQMHAQFDKQILTMTDDFKKKLIDQRESFSPAKNADILKHNQTLQVENKTLKKKVQLFSTELTKCFKTLQKYKQKLSECEKQYSDLINERNQLTDKINRLQSSHREKSNQSRSSMMRIAAPDNDRRNSMGETGHFTLN